LLVFWEQSRYFRGTCLVADECGPSLPFVGELLGGTLSKKHLFVIARIAFSIYGIGAGHLREVVVGPA